jgi:hypothetical protein
LRRIVLVLFHAVTLVVVLVNTCAQQYLRETGTTLDYAIVAEWIPKFGELTPILVGDVPLRSGVSSPPPYSTWPSVPLS